MITDSYAIEFDIQLEKTPIFLHLNAQVELHHSDPYYVISNFRTALQREGSILPAMKIKKKKDKWVHLDTEQPTYLSELVGEAIEEFEQTKRSYGNK
jgi:hypothetical protein